MATVQPGAQKQRSAEHPAAAAPAKFWAEEPSEEAVLSLGYCTSAAHPEILLGNVIAADPMAGPSLRA